jgi:HSP20 family protein
MSMITRRDGHLFAYLFDWLEAPLVTFRPATAPAIWMEAYRKDGYYVVRAELPGVDPEREVEVAVADGILTIKANRAPERAGKIHSGFRYGSFSRGIALPIEADADHIQASYDKGVLEVVVPLRTEAKESVRRIPVRLLQHITPT